MRNRAAGGGALRALSAPAGTTRIDVAETTKTRHVSELQRIGRLLGARRVDELTPAQVAEFVAALAAEP